MRVYLHCCKNTLSCTAFMLCWSLVQVTKAAFGASTDLVIFLLSTYFCLFQHPFVSMLATAALTYKQTCPHILSQVSLKSQLLSHSESCSMFTNCSFPANYRREKRIRGGRSGIQRRSGLPVVSLCNVCQIHHESQLEMMRPFVWCARECCWWTLQCSNPVVSCCNQTASGHLHCCNGHCL